MRAEPGTTAQLLSTMPLNADGRVALGPLPADGYDWYLIYYNVQGTGSVEGGFGWVAYGPATTPWLAPTDLFIGGYSFYAGDAGRGPGVVGPVEIGDNYGMRWAAVGQACPFVVSINDVEVVSTRVDAFAEGQVPLSELAGTFDIEVETECAWTLSHGEYQG